MQVECLRDFVAICTILLVFCDAVAIPSFDCPLFQAQEIEGVYCTDDQTILNIRLHTSVRDLGSKFGLDLLAHLVASLDRLLCSREVLLEHAVYVV